MKTNYKITNKISGNTHIMNQEEREIFFSHSKTQMSNWDKYGKRNMLEDYDIKEVTYLDKIPLWLITGGIFIAGLTSILLHIQLNY
jgi:hypothetical protein